MNKQMKTLDGVYFNDVTARQQIAGKADRVHTHSFNQLTNKPQIPEQYDDTQLRQQIAGKANANHTHSYDDLTDKPQAGESYDDTQLRQQIAGKANAVHTHSYNNLTDKPTIPEGYDDTQVKSDIVSLNTALTTLGNAKQDVISDLSTIRSGASAGADALPKNPDNWPTMTDAQKDTACSVMGAERAKGDWVLKGTIAGNADDRGNIDAGVNVDMSGCSEMYILSYTEGSANAILVINGRNSLSGFVKSGKTYAYAEYEDMPFGCICKEYIYNSATTLTSNGTRYNYVSSNNYFIRDINTIKLSSPENATKCDIKIYAR